MALLETHEVIVRFGGVTAVDRASLTVEAGRITGLIGPNGAGKTTTFNVITGLQEPTEGAVLLDGVDITSLAPQERSRRGMGRTFQRLEVFGSLTVYENLLVAGEIRRTWDKDAPPPEDEARRTVELVGLEDWANQLADAVPTGIARLTELGRALMLDPRLLLLDEPSSGLNEEESEGLGDLLVELVADGVGVLIVEHDMDLVMRICDDIFVLDFGAVIAQGPPHAIQTDPRVQAAYLGADTEARGETAAKAPA